MTTTKDPYVGERDHETRKRHGKGIYTYDNSYFQYEGQWNNGKKHGQGQLRMRCRDSIQVYEGQFVDGEIQGQGKLTYANGSQYIGEFKFGEKHGYGEFTSPLETYKGEWQQNMRHGKGVLKKENGDVIEGHFINHKPDGECVIKYANGSSYSGTMHKGLPHGIGKLIDVEQQIEYTGGFLNGRKHGAGIFRYTSNGFTYEGQFENDEPVHVPNIFVCRLQKAAIPQQSEQVAPDPTEKQESKDRVKTGDQEAQFEYEIGGRPFSLEICTAYQGPDILDPVQPTEEEIQEMIKTWEKDNKKIKNALPMPDFRAPRMTKPPPVLLDNESARKIKIQLVFVPEAEKGKESEPKNYIKMRLDYREKIRIRREEIEKIKAEREKLLQQQLLEEQQQQLDGAAKGKKEKKKETKKQGADANAQNEDDLRLALYDPKEDDKNKPLYVRNQQGQVVIENLEFPEDQPVGKFQLIVQDAALQKFGFVKELRTELGIIPLGGIDPKNKKKK